MTPKDQDEAELFFNAVKDVKPLKPHNLSTNRSREPVLSQPSRSEPALESEIKEETSFVKGGIHRKVLRHLRLGSIPIEDELDLHGCTVAEAKKKLQAFLLSAQVAGRQRAVRVVHGRGLRSPDRKSVLKENVYLWLRQNEAVLACCAATPASGGAGAVHVLLRRR
jgi:DNA-nicking Smr family endonuclease